MAMKMHMLGRVSFRAVKSKRDYLKHRSNFNWLYLSRLAALKEFAFMKVLEEHEFSVPNAIDCNQHCVIMSLVSGYPLVQVKELQNSDDVFEVGMIVRLAEHRLIHCDLNEFNIMDDDDEKVTMIDFPQMVSVSLAFIFCWFLHANLPLTLGICECIGFVVEDACTRPNWSLV